MSRQRAVADLGKWSSHPSTLKARHRGYMLLGGVPVALSLIGLLFLWRFGGVSILSLLAGWATWIPLVLGLMAFGCTFALTASLALRASTLTYCRGLPKGGRGIQIATWVSITLAMSLGAFVLSRGGLLGDVFGGDSMAILRLLGHLLGTMPMLLLLLAGQQLYRPVDEWGRAEEPTLQWRATARRVFHLLWQAGFYIMVMIIIDRVAAWVDSYEASLRSGAAGSQDDLASKLLFWVPGLGVRVDPNLALAEFIAGSRDWVSAVVVLGALALLVVFFVKELCSRMGSKSGSVRPVEAIDVVRAQGYLHTPSGETWALPHGGTRSSRTETLLWEDIAAGDQAGGSSEEDEVPDQEDDDGSGSGPPSWFIELSKTSSIDADWDEPVQAELGETSESSGRLDLAHLFSPNALDGQAILTPTRAQVAAFEEFDRIFERFLEAEDREQAHVYPALDMLVTGGAGSGKTTLLLACALNAVVTRGQTVLVFVPEVEKSRLFVRRLRQLAANAGVGWHVAVGELSEKEVVSWSDPLEGEAPKHHELHRSPIGSLPDILIGTPNDYERLLYGADHGGPMVRRCLLRMQTVLIEDLTTFTSEERRHLPFLLEKHRLILRSEHVPTQFLALAPDLGDNLATQLGNRLFSERERTHHMRLRPPVRKAPWVVDLVAASPRAAAEQLVAAASSADLESVLWLPETPLTERKKLTSRIQRNRNVRVIADMDELDAGDVQAAALAVYRSNTGQVATQAFCARLDDGDAVVVRVTTPAGARQDKVARWALPVLPSVESEVLSVAHLKSAARYLSAWTPVARDSWARLGLGGAGQLMGKSPQEARFEQVPGYSLVLDPPEKEVEPGSVAARGDVWPWIAVQTEGRGGGTSDLPMVTQRPVRIYHPLDRGEQKRLDSSGGRLVLGNIAADEQAIAAWRSSDGLSLASMDLAYADRLLHRHGDYKYWPETIEQDEGGQGEVRIRGKHFEDKGAGESFMATWDLEVRVPGDTKLEFSQGGVVGDYMRWATLLDAREGAAQPVEAAFWLTGTYDALGHRAPVAPPLYVYYSTRVSLLRIGPIDAELIESSAGLAEELLTAFTGGSWSTCPDSGDVISTGRAWPLLGLVLTAALRPLLPGLFGYARLGAFSGPQGTAFEGCAFLLVVEPAGTSGTARDAFERLLGESSMLVDLCQNALGRLRAMQASNPDMREHQLEILEVAAGVQVGRVDRGSAEAERHLRDDLDRSIRLLEGLEQELEQTSRQLSVRPCQEGGAS
jgi:hypothetical protein